MQEFTSPKGNTRARLVNAVLWGGLIAGTLDIADALIFHGVRGVAPWRILQAIASGLLGREAFTGGAWTATLGLGLHFFIATTVAAVTHGQPAAPRSHCPPRPLRSRVWPPRKRRHAVRRACRSRRSGPVCLPAGHD